MRRIKNINKMICKSADVHVYLSVYAAHRHTKKKLSPGSLCEIYVICIKGSNLSFKEKKFLIKIASF